MKGRASLTCVVPMGLPGSGKTTVFNMILSDILGLDPLPREAHVIWARRSSRDSYQRRSNLQFVYPKAEAREASIDGKWHWEVVAVLRSDALQKQPTKEYGDQCLDKETLINEGREKYKQLFGNFIRGLHDAVSSPLALSDTFLKVSFFLDKNHVIGEPRQITMNDHWRSLEENCHPEWEVMRRIVVLCAPRDISVLGGGNCGWDFPWSAATVARYISRCVNRKWHPTVERATAPMVVLSFLELHRGIKLESQNLEIENVDVVLNLPEGECKEPLSTKIEWIENVVSLIRRVMNTPGFIPFKENSREVMRLMEMIMHECIHHDLGDNEYDLDSLEKEVEQLHEFLRHVFCPDALPAHAGILPESKTFVNLLRRRLPVDGPLNTLSRRPINTLSRRPINTLSRRPLNAPSSSPLNAEAVPFFPRPAPIAGYSKSPDIEDRIPLYVALRPKGNRILFHQLTREFEDHLQEDPQLNCLRQQQPFMAMDQPKHLHVTSHYFRGQLMPGHEECLRAVGHSYPVRITHLVWVPGVLLIATATPLCPILTTGRNEIMSVDLEDKRYDAVIDEQLAQKQVPPFPLPEGKVPHVTMAYGSGMRPAASNTLLHCLHRLPLSLDAKFFCTPGRTCDFDALPLKTSFALSGAKDMWKVENFTPEWPFCNLPCVIWSTSGLPPARKDFVGEMYNHYASSQAH